MNTETLEELKKRKNQLIWESASGWEIMWLSRHVFDELARQNLVGAHIERASDHYSLVKRWWTGPFAVYHLLRAARHANAAFDLSGAGTQLSLNQIDVVSRIFVKAAWLQKGHVSPAKRLVEYALYNHPEREKMLPHTRALLLITLGMIHHELSDRAIALQLYKEAAELEYDIRMSTAADALKQLCRIKFDVGCYLIDHGNKRDHSRGKTMLADAYSIAKRNSPDQRKKVKRGMNKRGVYY